jgi:SAM-dependent methyltransferase/(2Fe-2S) ferredoxin
MASNDFAVAAARPEGAGRHVLFCVREAAELRRPEIAALWQALGAALDAAGLTRTVRRTRALEPEAPASPLLIVYPEGAWYGGLTVAAVHEIVACHLGAGQLAVAHCLCVHPLSGHALDMKGDWNRRAHDRAKYFIATAEPDDPDAFRASGERDVRAFFRGYEHLLHAGQDVVDIGCGIGRMDEFVAPRVRRLTGVDVSGEMVRLATARLAHVPNVRFVEGDGTSLPLPDASADLVFSHIVLQHTPRHVTVAYVGDVFRVLRAGGSFVFQMPEAVPGAPHDPPQADTFEMRFWSEADLRLVTARGGFEWVGLQRHRVESEYLVFDQLVVHCRKPA